MGKPGIPQSHETPVLGGYSKIAHTHPAGYQGGFLGSTKHGSSVFFSRPNFVVFQTKKLGKIFGNFF
jgi:hypothetical protein